MLVGWLAVIPYQLEASDHLANSEKAEDLGGNETNSGQLSATDISDGTQSLLWVDGVGKRAGGGCDGSRIPDDVGQRLEVRLKLSQRAARVG